MIERERLENINFAAAKHLQDWLRQLADEEIDGDDLLAAVYGGMIAAILMGYNPEAILEDVKRGADYIIKNSPETDEE